MAILYLTHGEAGIKDQSRDEPATIRFAEAFVHHEQSPYGRLPE